MRDDRGLDAVRGLSHGRARGRDRRHRGRRRQRPERADPGARRHARARTPGSIELARRRRHARDPARGHATPASGTSPRIASATGSCSTSRWPRTRALHDYDRAADLAHRLARPRRHGRRGQPSGSSSTTCAAAAPRRRRGALSGGNQQKVVLAREIQSNPRAADRGPADARPRRRRDRVRAPPPRRAARRRLRRAARVVRARRGARPRRPHPRHVRGPDRARARERRRRTSASSASP